MAQPGYLDRNLTWTRRNAIITLIGISNYLWLNRHLSQNQIHRNRFICSNPLIRWKERKNGWNWIRVSRNFINLIPRKIRGMIDEKSWIDVKLIFEYIVFLFRKRREGVVRKGASSDKIARLGRGKWRKGRQNDASMFCDCVEGARNLRKSKFRFSLRRAVDFAELISSGSDELKLF